MTPSPGICTKPRLSIRYLLLSSFSRYTTMSSTSPGRNTPTLRVTMVSPGVTGRGGGGVPPAWPSASDGTDSSATASAAHAARATPATILGLPSGIAKGIGADELSSRVERRGHDLVRRVPDARGLE